MTTATELAALPVQNVADLPTGWRLVSLGKLVSVKNGADYKADEVSEGGYPVIGSGGEFARSSCYSFDGPSVLFGRKGTIDQPLYVEGRFWTVDTMFYTIIGPQIVGRFLYYFATTVDFDYYATNTAVPSMTQRDISTFKVPLPSIETQQQVADYLDTQTAKIDALIGKQEQLIETLAERRQAVISHAVTKGLDPDSPMKNSGVEWLGAIPNHWLVPRVSHHFSIVLGKMVNAGKGNQPGTDVVPYLRAGNVQPYGIDIAEVKTMPMTDVEREQLSLQLGDLVVVEGGQGGYGRSALVLEDLTGWAFQNHVMRVRPKRGESNAFLDYVIKTLRSIGYIASLSSHASLPSFSSEKLAAIRYGQPPLREQDAIVEYLDNETSKIDALSAKAREMIDILKERRQALISAAVTGKIDVRGLT